jgi:hypothetical protein
MHICFNGTRYTSCQNSQWQERPKSTHCGNICPPIACSLNLEEARTWFCAELRPDNAVHVKCSSHFYQCHRGNIDNREVSPFLLSSCLGPSPSLTGTADDTSDSLILYRTMDPNRTTAKKHGILLFLVPLSEPIDSLLDGSLKCQAFWSRKGIMQPKKLFNMNTWWKSKSSTNILQYISNSISKCIPFWLLDFVDVLAEIYLVRKYSA